MKCVYHVDYKTNETGYLILCPSCNIAHFYPDGEEGWSFNWDFEKPTFRPSLNIGPRKDGSVCHFNVVNGIIKFDPESTHELRNKAVALPDVPPEWL